MGNEMLSLAAISEVSEEFDSQAENIMNNLQNLLNDGKIDDHEYQKLKESIEQEIDRKKENIVGGFTLDPNLDNELKNSLSDDEYSMINNEMLALVAMTEDSDEFDSQAENIMDNIESLFNDGKMDNKEYQKL